MPTTLAAPEAPSLSPVTAKHLTTARVIRSEWIKARTLRSTWITAIATLIVIIGFGLLAAQMSLGRDGAAAGPGAPAGTGAGPLSTVVAGANLAVLLVAVWGSVFGAREFSSGLIRTTLAAVPTRRPVLWAKLAAFCAITIPTVLIGTVTAFLGGMALLSGGGSAALAFSDDGVARAVLGTAYYICGLGLIGLALGVMLRNTAAAIATVLGAVLFLPALAGALLPDSWSSVLRYLPSSAAQSFTNLTSSTDQLSATQGAPTFTAWIVLAVAGALLVLLRQDP